MIAQQFVQGLRYSVPPQDDALRETLAKLDEGFAPVGAHRAGNWDDSWRQHLERFEVSGFDMEALRPRFVGATPLLRYAGQYIKPEVEDFEWTFFQRLRQWVFSTFLGDVAALHEFGSGSATNVAAFARSRPDIPVFAHDWSPAAVKMAELLHEKCGLNVKGERVDFFQPDFGLHPHAGVLTCCALEQVGCRFSPFLRRLLELKPKRVVHIEPLLELYDQHDAFDQAAIRYHLQRGYLMGMLPWLEKRVDILLKQRLHFGSRFGESFMLLVWEP
jgi:hypothetical protein